MVKTLSAKLTQRTHDLVFRTVHSRNLIYNACWEDPRIDRRLLGLDEQSRVVVLTSAGCNALDYLLDGPASIDAVDVNPRQNALLWLKIALIERGHHDDLFRFFGDGRHPEHRRVYGELRHRLPAQARRFWDHHVDWFDAASRRGSFYYRGTSGAVAWLLTRYLLQPRRKLKPHLHDLIQAATLEEQRAIYAAMEPRLWRRLDGWLLNQPLIMSMLGVPRPQLRLIKDEYPGGLVGYIRDKFKHVLTEVLIHDNYFWRVYLTGSYTRDCCPNYLRPEHFDTLQSNVHRIRVHTTTVSDFLRRRPAPYSHYVLLDHQDWLARHDPVALEQEWRLILANSVPGARVLMRSASHQVDYIPEAVRDALAFLPDLAHTVHREDRVGTYGSVNLAVVR